MKHFSVQYYPTWQRGPMTYWVHVEAGGHSSGRAEAFDPPAPSPVPGKGYPLYIVEIDGAALRFASRDELRVCIDTLAQRVLPSNLLLSRRRGTGYGPSSHWLNRLPLRSMTWPHRLKVIKYLRTALAAFEAEALLPR